MHCLVLCFLIVICAENAGSRGVGPTVPAGDRTARLPSKASRLSPGPRAQIVVGSALTTAEVHDVVRLSVKPSVWHLRSGARIVMLVTLNPIAQREEDLFMFHITVSAGADSACGGEHARACTQSSIVDVPAGGSAKLLSRINELVSKVSRKCSLEFKE